MPRGQPLTEQQVNEIISMTETRSNRCVAAMLGISRKTVIRVLANNKEH